MTVGQSAHTAFYTRFDNRMAAGLSLYTVPEYADCNSYELAGNTTGVGVP